MKNKNATMTKMKNAKKILQTFNEIIEIYIKTSNLLMNKELREYLMIGLEAMKKAKASSTNDLGKNLLKALQAVENRIDIHKTLFSKV